MKNEQTDVFLSLGAAVSFGALALAIYKIFKPRAAYAASTVDLLPRAEPAPAIPTPVPTPVPTPTPRPPKTFQPERYVPGSAAQIALFKQAAQAVGLPATWAESPGLINILKRESNGWVGIPNYTFGERQTDKSRWPEVWRELRAGKITARSSATGLGQLLLSNVDKYYPHGRAGIGVAVEEAAGMLNYIKDRYRTPENAWSLYGKIHEGY